MNTLFAGLGIDLNRIDGIISKTLTMLPTLFATTRGPLLDKNVNILLIREEIVTVINLNFIFHLVNVTN